MGDQWRKGADIEASRTVRGCCARLDPFELSRGIETKAGSYLQLSRRALNKNLASATAFSETRESRHRCGDKARRTGRAPAAAVWGWLEFGFGEEAHPSAVE